ncbi:unnamed protein product [Linum trigynum]|uniref:Uncharacterized protein n=1 Tax=Linum trigynum TaxID=586398 RepID=A0AAV2F0K9_9ROSI
MSSSSPIVYSISLLLSLALIFIFAPEILPSQNPFSSPHDDLDDLALFNKALRSVHGDSRGGHRRLRISRLATKNPTTKIAARGENAMMPEVPFDKFRVGSQFFVLAKRHALLVLSDRKLWRKFRLQCLNLDSCYPEEHYFPTLLSMADPKGCSKFTLTNVNWTGSWDGHPYTYEAPEISAGLIRRLIRA